MRYGDVEKVVIVYDQRVDNLSFEAFTIVNFNQLDGSFSRLRLYNNANH